MKTPSGLHRIETRYGKNRLTLYLLVVGRTALLVDSGIRTTPDDIVYPYLAATGLPPRAITQLLITHGHLDHFGGNAAVRDHSPAVKIMVHGLDRQFVEHRDSLLRDWYQHRYVEVHGYGVSDATVKEMRELAGPEVAVDCPLTGGEELDLGSGRTVHVVHTPGHMPGHVSLWDPRHRMAIVGEALLGRGVPDASGILRSPPPYCDVEAYISSLSVIEELGPDLVLSSHHPDAVGSEVAEVLRESRQFVEDCNSVLMDVFTSAGQPLSLRDVVARVDERLGPYDQPELAWLAPLAAHLRFLETRGDLTVVPGGFPRAWSRS